MKRTTIFEKLRPDIRLTTRFDAEGREIEVEVREDEESTRKQQEIMDILVKSGYFRAYIRGLSAFNKIVGGMVWCMDACDHDVDVDLLFDESLTIGQQIALTEKIITVLIEMSCPFQLEPHQIQGLDVIHIYPVIVWLCKKSTENRREKAKKLKEFAVGQFHNSFQLASDARIRQANLRMLENIRHVEGLFGPQRQYRRKVIALRGSKNDDRAEEIAIEILLKSLSITGEEEIDKLDLDEVDRQRLKQHFAQIRSEVEEDSEELRRKNQLSELDAEIKNYEDQLKEIDEECENLTKNLENISTEKESQRAEQKELVEEIDRLQEREDECDKSVLETVQQLIQENERLKQEEQEFKENCRKEMSSMQEMIDEEERNPPGADVQALQQELISELEQLQANRLQVARQNRQITTLQRQIDNIPDRTELAQYQSRFLELYNQVLSRQRETKQYFSLFNTLSQTKNCLEKELSLHNSICESYQQAMSSSSAKAEFLKQLETYVDGIGQLKAKQKQRCDEEKARRVQLNEVLLGLVDEQRHLAAIMKQLKQEFTRNDELSREYKVLMAVAKEQEANLE